MKVNCLDIKKLFSAGFFALVLVVSLTVGGEAKADIIGDLVTQAGKTFISSILENYTKDTKSTFGTQYKSVEQTIKELSAQVKKADNPKLKPEERSTILEKIAENQKSLQEYANSFSNLADKTDKYNGQVQTALQDWFTTANQQVQGKLTSDKDAFSQIANAITAIAKDTKGVDSNNIGNFLTDISGHIDSLNKVSETASKLIETFAS